MVGLVVHRKGEHIWFFVLMIRRPPRSTQGRSSAASDVYKRQMYNEEQHFEPEDQYEDLRLMLDERGRITDMEYNLSLIHISEPTRPY